MRLARIALASLTALTPLSLQFHEQGDTLATVTTPDGTRIEVMAGTGAYAFIARGCEGQVVERHPVSFRDAGARVEVPIGRRGPALGVRAGVLREDIAGGLGLVSPPPVPYAGNEPARDIRTNRYLNAYLSLEYPGIGLGAGWVWHEKDFLVANQETEHRLSDGLSSMSAHFRLGSESRYFEARWLEGMPLYSDGGYLVAGFGERPAGGPWTFFVGMGAAGPYEGAGLALRAGRDFDSGLRVNARARLGRSGDANASGVALGVGWGPPRP